MFLSRETKNHVTVDFTIPAESFGLHRFTTESVKSRPKNKNKKKLVVYFFCSEQHFSNRMDKQRFVIVTAFLRDKIKIVFEKSRKQVLFREIIFKLRSK